MRLVCPNCSAQYEVDGSMIPDDGRDVQCSNCGHTWFELPGPRDSESDFAASDDFLDAATDEEEDLDIPSDDRKEDASDEVTDSDEDEYEEIEEPRTTARRETRPENLSREQFFDDDEMPATGSVEKEDEEDAVADDLSKADSEEDDERDRTSEAIRAVTAAAASVDDDEDDAPIGSPPGRKRAPADIAALDILREEAEREMTKRRATPSENIETQTDLGLEDIRNRKTPSRALRARMAHLGEEMPGEEDPDTTTLTKSEPVSRPADEEDGYEEPRRDLLPDIEEINSTLSTSAGETSAAEAQRRSGFRVGFLLMLFLAVAIVFAYAQAPAIARALPETEPTLIAFVDWANGMRDQIDGLIGN